jgi:hypothetical protein
MNCFYHQDRVAVALCKSCLRGLCAECAVDVGDGVACRNSCEVRAKRINKIVDSNAKVMSLANTSLRRNFYFTSTCGIIFTTLGGWMAYYGKDSFVGALFALLGIVFIIRGVSSYTKRSRYPDISNNS